MKRWTFTAALYLILAVLYVACQAEAVKEDPPSAKPVVLETVVEEEAPQEKAPERKEEPLPVVEKVERKEAEVAFAENAFPPTVSDMDYHKDAWYRNDCLRCHETGVEEATVVKHEDMPAVLLTAKCRSCHVLIPGQKPVKRKPEATLFAENAFPPLIPASRSHQDAWLNDTCLLCHETGNRGAPIVKHKGMPALLLKAKCRSCHVQVRSTSIPGR
jgi:hypothetical protein